MFDIENNSGPIDILIGADVAGRLFTGKRRVLSSGLVAMETNLGLTLMEKNYFTLSEKEDAAMMLISILEVLGISDLVEMKNKRERENLTKLHSEETVRINTEGIYEVSQPWKENYLRIPSNNEIAMKRLESSTKKLHQETLFTAYDDVFKEWELLGIIENDPVDSSSHLHEYFLSHRPVVKQLKCAQFLMPLPDKLDPHRSTSV
ncbi:integrase catalytic domain-containing protein [Trichonephila clavipes]|uniref:Integrase catalytic domain-containing protein n=1 Tax=Trichonephila clavipes TaxID=2585209 RepID=A0A8X7BL04_TRICX|nr:integrase catalytic domain-containing protein [Trichonephila clavipes]